MILYEINSRLNGKSFSELTKELKNYKDFHFDILWLMGLWKISPLALTLSKRYSSDFEGSPYAIFDYSFNPDLGSAEEFKKLKKQAHKLGLKIIVDFVPNHFALDTPLIDQYPEFFISSDQTLREEYANDYFIHPSGKKLAHGKDPYFEGWIDTVQLNYSNKELRIYMCRILEQLATIADGVRCDMAMLILRDQIKRQWFTYLPQDQFDKLMPSEFWDEAIYSARKVNPNFLFIAEAYWDTEEYLQQLGFNYTYNKKLYDVLILNEPDSINHYLKLLSEEFIKRSVHFIENHDEERIITKLSPLAARRAVILIMLLPGLSLIHQGQMEGSEEKVPVQRTKFLKDPVLDIESYQFYKNLFVIASKPIFCTENWAWAESNWNNTVCFWRYAKELSALIILPLGDSKIQIPDKLYITQIPLDISKKLKIAKSGFDNKSQLVTSYKNNELIIDKEEIIKSFSLLGFFYIEFD